MKKKKKNLDKTKTWKKLRKYLAENACDNYECNDELERLKYRIFLEQVLGDGADDRTLRSLTAKKRRGNPGAPCEPDFRKALKHRVAVFNAFGEKGAERLYGRKVGDDFPDVPKMNGMKRKKAKVRMMMKRALLLSALLKGAEEDADAFDPTKNRLFLQAFLAQKTDEE